MTEEPKKKNFVQQSADIQKQIQEARARGDSDAEALLQEELKDLADSFFKPRMRMRDMN